MADDNFCERNCPMVITGIDLDGYCNNCTPTNAIGPKYEGEIIQ